MRLSVIVCNNYQTMQILAQLIEIIDYSYGYSDIKAKTKEKVYRKQG